MGQRLISPPGIVAHARFWKFHPPRGRETEFAEAYSSSGLWARLFGRSPAFLGTQLMRPIVPGDVWLTIDTWASVDAFEAFQREFGGDYRRLDAELEGLAGDEEFVGAFEVED